jgi:hypothetical protein
LAEKSYQNQGIVVYQRCCRILWEAAYTTIFCLFVARTPWVPRWKPTISVFDTWCCTKCSHCRSGWAWQCRKSGCCHDGVLSSVHFHWVLPNAQCTQTRLASKGQWRKCPWQYEKLTL